MERALRLWRDLLRPGGAPAFTELTRLASALPPGSEDFWREAYPAMTDEGGNRRRAETAGYEVIGTFPLPGSDWDAYYAPVRERIRTLRPQGARRPALAAVIAEVEREMEVFARFGDSQGYVFYVLRKPDGRAAS